MSFTSFVQPLLTQARVAEPREATVSAAWSLQSGRERPWGTSMQGTELEAPSSRQVTGEWSHLAKLHPGGCVSAVSERPGFPEKLELRVRTRRAEGRRPGTSCG